MSKTFVLQFWSFGRGGFASISFNSKSLAPWDAIRIRRRSEYPDRFMQGRRYSVVVADRSSGAVRRATVSLRPFLSIITFILVLPVLVGLGAKWSARSEIEQLRTANSALEIENGSYRAATGELTTQIQSLESVIDDLGARAQLDPTQSRAMQKLPAMVKARAAGGNVQPNAAVSEIAK